MSIVKKIHKYYLFPNDRPVPNKRVTLSIPEGSKVIAAAMPGENLVLWAEFTCEEQDREPRTFVCLWTGHEFEQAANEQLRHVNTVTDGDLVWHVYELTKSNVTDVT